MSDSNLLKIQESIDLTLNQPGALFQVETQAEGIFSRSHGIVNLQDVSYTSKDTFQFSGSEMAEKEQLKNNEILAIYHKGIIYHMLEVDGKEEEWTAFETESSEWDEIVCIYGHFPTELHNKTLKGVKKAIRPGGYFLTEVYSPYQLSYKTGGPQDIDFLYRIEEFLETFSDWRIIHLFLGEVTRHEGELHNGLAHVIQFVGQKPK